MREQMARTCIEKDPSIFTVGKCGLLGAFAKLRKRLLASSCLSVRPSAPTGWILMKCDILAFFESLEKILNH
jgi:hypothetical protein